MPTTRNELVLSSPLGRQFLFEQLGFSPDTRLFEALSLGPVPGQTSLTSGSARESRTQDQAPHHVRSWTEVTPDEVVREIDVIGREGKWNELRNLDELQLLERLRRSTFSFGFREKDEMVWGLTDVGRDALRPLADALLGSPATARWWEPLDRDNQRHVQWSTDPYPSGTEIDEAIRESMTRERMDNEQGLSREMPTFPAGTRIGAEWWSAPSFTMLTSTTPPVGDIPALGLQSFVDIWRPSREAAATIWSIRISDSARVLEINGPSDWRRLVERHPRDVTGTHNGEWRSWSGKSGPWRLPDWESVAKQYDGVHVTIGGYLSANGLALPAADGFTVLAGWVPGETLWLRDMAHKRELLGKWSGDPFTQSWEEIRDGLS